VGRPSYGCILSKRVNRNSHSLVSAWIGVQLVGLGNSLSDGFLVVYYRICLYFLRIRGVASVEKIMERMKSKYRGFHQHILVADGRAVNFYKKHGFERAGKNAIHVDL
jgi:hypothetical protein